MGETDIWWNTLRNRLLGHDFIWSRFVKELITTLQFAKWELKNAHGAVARARHCCLFLKIKGCR